MKAGIIVVAALLVVAIAAPQAGAIGIMGSWWQQDDLKNGYGVGLVHEFGLVPIVSIDARASWLSFSEESAEANLFPLEAAGKVKLGLFYAGAGLGYYVFDGKKGANIDNKLGGFLLGGARFGLLGLGAFAELKYTFLETDVNVDGAGSSKLKANGVGINLGVTLPF